MLIPIADPGFPMRGGAPTPDFGAKTYYLVRFFSEKMKMKEAGSGGGGGGSVRMWRPPLDVPMYPVLNYIS